MCGISGWFLSQGQKREVMQLNTMADAIAHRGPDDRGYFVDEARGIAFAHNRLSIIDLSSAGHQPMLSEDGNMVLVYNGELYNFQELRKELEGLYGSEFSAYLKFLKRIRVKALIEIGHRKRRETFLKSLASQKILLTLREKGIDAVKKVVTERLKKVVK